MRGPHNLWRLIRTGATFERTGAMRTALEAFDAPPTLRVAARVLGWPFQWLGYEGDPTQPPILRALTALGPAYIKFGQLLSTRPDVVGPELAAQLTRAAGQAAAVPDGGGARPRSRHELGQPLDAVFADFEPPVAAASLAQVHRARLRETGQVVAVKVLRPGIERAFLRDVDAFYFAAGMIELLAPFARRLRPEGGDPPFRGRGAGRARPAHGGLRRGRVRGEHRTRPGLPRARGDLARLGPPRADPRMGDRHQHGRPRGARRPAAPTSCGSPSGSSRPS